MTEGVDPFFIPFLRSCKQESAEQINGETKGEIPKWLHGCLIRVGPGLMEVGPDKYNHIFDGLALMHRFSFQDGKITYQNRFLRSDTYQKNMKANRIIVDEFGTSAAPDPCKTIFQRFASLFSAWEMTDNDLVNMVRYTDEVYACSETNFIWKVDQESLESVEKADLSKFVAVKTATAHPHEDRDGTVYNVGHTFGLHSAYNIIKFPPKETPSSGAFEKGSIVCKIPALHGLHPSYFHSFGMTENYFILVEQPLFTSLPKMAAATFKLSNFADALQFNSCEMVRIHVVCRKTGTPLETHYAAKPFFVFHHINAYEENEHIIVDLCTYENGGIVKGLYVAALQEFYKNEQKTSSPFFADARRYVLPLDVKNAVKNENLLKLENCQAKAFLQNDGSILCEPEILAAGEKCPTELPRINYESFNTKKYTYFYAVGQNPNSKDVSLVKVNTQDGTTLHWAEEGAIPSEPVFVADPNASSDEEDGGVLLASLVYKNDATKVSLLVVNARDMQELGRAKFATASAVPGTFHGIFLPK